MVPNIFTEIVGVNFTGSLDDLDVWVIQASHLCIVVSQPEAKYSLGSPFIWYFGYLINGK